MVRHRGAEADDPAGDEDRREDEHVGDVLAAPNGSLLMQEVAWLSVSTGWRLQAGAQGLARSGPAAWG